MMDKVSAKPGNLALIVSWRPGDWSQPGRFVMLRFIKPERLATAGVLAYDTRDLEIIS